MAISLISALAVITVSSGNSTSVGDVKWLDYVVGFGGNGGEDFGIDLTLPPIASNDPILAWVWSSIALIHVHSLNDKIKAAN